MRITQIAIAGLAFVALLAPPARAGDDDCRNGTRRSSRSERRADRRENFSDFCDGLSPGNMCHGCQCCLDEKCAALEYWKCCGIYPLSSPCPDPRDTRLYSAQGYGMPIAVPLAPVVKHQYNYGWGLPSSRLTRVGYYENYWPAAFTSQAGNAAYHGEHPPTVYWPTDTTQLGYYGLRVPSWTRRTVPFN